MAILNFLNKKASTSKPQSAGLIQPKPAQINPSAGVFYQSQVPANQPAYDINAPKIQPNPPMQQPMGGIFSSSIPNQTIPQATTFQPAMMPLQAPVQNVQNPTGIHSYQQTSLLGNITDTSGGLFGNDSVTQVSPNIQPQPSIQIPESKPVFADMPADASVNNSLSSSESIGNANIDAASEQNDTQTQALVDNNSNSATANPAQALDFSDFKIPDLSGFKLDVPVKNEQIQPTENQDNKSKEFTDNQIRESSEVITSPNTQNISTNSSRKQDSKLEEKLNESQPSQDKIENKADTNTEFDKTWYVTSKPEDKEQEVETMEEDKSDKKQDLLEVVTTSKEKVVKKKKSKFLLQKIGISGLNSQDVLYVQAIDNIAAICPQYNIKLVFDSETGLGVNLIDLVSKNNITSMGVFYKPFEAEYINYLTDTASTANTSSITTFYYSNVLEQVQFFIKESRAFILFNDNTFVTYSLLVNLMHLVDLYRISSKPVILIGKGWRNKVESIVMDLQIDPEVKKYITILDNANDIANVLIDINNRLLTITSSAPKVIDRRLQGDERDLHIAP